MSKKKKSGGSGPLAQIISARTSRLANQITQPIRKIELLRISRATKARE